MSSTANPSATVVLIFVTAREYNTPCSKKHDKYKHLAYCDIGMKYTSISFYIIMKILGKIITL